MKVRITLVAIVAALAVSACSGSGSPASSSSSPSGAPATQSGGLPGTGTGALATLPARGPVFDVTRYGAHGDGRSDNTTAFVQAIAAAQQASGGGTVYVPSGRYLFTQQHTARPASLVVDGSVPIVIMGAGRDSTTLVEGVADKGLLSVRASGTVVESLTLDTQSNDGGAAIFVVADHTSLLASRVLGGSRHFALYYAGPQGASPDSPAYNTGNTVRGLDLNDRLCDDGFSWSFQENGSISSVTHTGSRLALYVDRTTQVSDYTYTPGQQQCGARNGFWITPPAAAITITNFTSSGQGGKIGLVAHPAPGRVAADVTIVGERLTGSGESVAVGDVTNLVMRDCDLGDGTITLRPVQVAQVHLVHCRYGALARHPAAGAQLDVSSS